MSLPKSIALIQGHIPHYRIQLFTALQAEAARRGYRLTVYSGDQALPKALPFSHRMFPVRPLGKDTSGAFWIEGLAQAVAGSDIIIAPHGVQCVTIPYLWLQRKRLCSSWIWWGHGYNFQATTQASINQWLTTTVKDFLLMRGDGVITYTHGGAQYWCDRGLSPERVAPFFNTIDVEGLQETGRQVTEHQVAQTRERLGLGGKQVLLFSGRLYAEKQVDFLLQAFAKVQHARPDTALLILGDGQERGRLEDLRRSLDLHDVHFLGELTDPRDTSIYFKLAQLLAIPGLVGLAIVHGFAFNLPLITTERTFHSPEIEYLSKENGSMTAHDLDAYAAEIVRILSTPENLKTMQLHCDESARRLTLAASAKRFMQAVIQFSDPTESVTSDRRRSQRTSFSSSAITTSMRR